MARWKIWLLVTIIFGVGVFLRTYRIAELPPGLYPDEAMNGSNAFEAIATGNYKVYYPENNGREGLFMNIQAQFLKVLVPMNNGNPEPWMLRLASTIFGSLTVLGMFFLGRELFRNSQFAIRNSGSTYIDKATLTGIAAMFFTATSFWHIMFSRIGFRAIMAPFFLVWAVALLLIAIRKAKTSHFSSLISAVVGGIAFGLGFYSYIAYRVSPLLLLLVVPFFRKEPNFWKVAGVFVAAAFIVALPIGLYYLQNPADFMGRTSQVSVFSSPEPLKELGFNIVKTLQMFFVVGDMNQRHNLSGAPQLFWPVGLMFLLGIGLGCKSFFKKTTPPKPQAPATAAETHSVKINPLTIGIGSAPEQAVSAGEGSAATGRFGIWLCFVWIFLTALPVVISNEGLPHALRAILMIPPVFLLAGMGVAWVYEKLATRSGQWTARALPAIIGFAVAVCLAQAYRQYFVAWANDPTTPGAFAANYVEIGRAIQALPRETPVYVHVEAGGVDVRGIPMPAQTVMYMTDSFTPEKQEAKKIYYVLPGDSTFTPPNTEYYEYYVR